MTMRDVSDERLIETGKQLVRTERRTLSRFLSYLIEMDRRKLYLKEAHPSLFSYLTRVLGLSESSALKRIQVARCAARFPRLLDDIAAQKLTLTNACVLAPHLDGDNCEQLLAEASGKSKFQVQRLVASPVCAGEYETLTPVSQTRTRLEFTVDDETLEMLEKLKSLLRHQFPKAKLEDITKAAFKALLEKVDPTKEPKRVSKARPRRHTRYVPKPIAREVWKRDQSCCTHRSPDGKQCPATSFLQIDHLTPWSLGSSSWDISNLALKCRAHNQWKGGATPRVKPP